MRRDKLILLVAGIVVGLSLVSFTLGGVSELNILESFRIVFGSVFVLFLPGFVWSFVFFPARRGLAEDKGGIDLIERIALSFALSIAVVPLTVFYLNLIGLKISAWSSFFVVLGLIVVGAGIVFWRNQRKSKF